MQYLVNQKTYTWTPAGACGSFQIVVHSCSENLISLTAAQPQASSVLTMSLKECGTVPEKEQALLFLCNRKTQSLRSATVTEVLNSSEKLTHSCYRINTGAVEYNKAKRVLSQQSFRTLNCVSIPCTLLRRQLSASITVIATDYFSYSHLFSNITVSSTVACACGQAQFWKDLCSDFGEKSELQKKNIASSQLPAPIPQSKTLS